MLLFHGGGGYDDAIRYQSRMDSVSDRKGFIVIYPASYNKRILKDRLPDWNDVRVYQNGCPSKIDDVAFVEGLLENLKALFNIDEKRIYAAGFSSGAQFFYQLAKELSNH